METLKYVKNQLRVFGTDFWDNFLLSQILASDAYLKIAGVNLIAAKNEISGDLQFYNQTTALYCRTHFNNNKNGEAKELPKVFHMQVEQLRLKFPKTSAEGINRTSELIVDEPPIETLSGEALFQKANNIEFVNKFLEILNKVQKLNSIGNIETAGPFSISTLALIAIFDDAGLNLNDKSLSGLTLTPAAADHASSKFYVNSQDVLTLQNANSYTDSQLISLQGKTQNLDTDGDFNSNFSMNNHTISGLEDPSADFNATHKLYVDTGDADILIAANLYTDNQTANFVTKGYVDFEIGVLEGQINTLQDKTQYVSNNGISLDVPSSYVILVNGNNAISFLNNTIDVFKEIKMNGNQFTDAPLPILPGNLGNKEYIDLRDNKVIWEGPLTGTTPIVILNADIKPNVKYTVLQETSTVANQNLQVFVNRYKFVRQDTNEGTGTDTFRTAFGLLGVNESVQFIIYKGFNNQIVISQNRDNLQVGNNTGILREAGRIDAGGDLQIRSNQSASTDYIKIREM